MNLKYSMSISIECEICGKQGYAETHNSDEAEESLTKLGWKIVESSSQITCACPECAKNHKEYQS